MKSKSAFVAFDIGGTSGPQNLGLFITELTNKHVHLAQKLENLKMDVGECGAVTERCAISQKGDEPAISSNTCELQSSCHFTSALSISHKNLFLCLTLIENL